jgi:hypothetical protein
MLAAIISGSVSNDFTVTTLAQTMPYAWQGGAFKATGTVTFTNDGKPEKIVLELQRSGNDWRIADIDWDSGNLRGTFRRKAAYHGEALPR